MFREYVENLEKFRCDLGVVDMESYILVGLL